MHLIVAAVGRMRGSPLRAAWDDYAGRLTWTCELREIESRSSAGPRRTSDEGVLLRRAVASSSVLVALDRSGTAMESEQLAARLTGWRDTGSMPIGFAIGGADGLSSDLVADADLVLSFGRQTWPHLLARVMLIEQVYRCQTILGGHPYHRGGCG